MIVIRQRFPNFICDGRPFENDEDYYNRFEKTEDFYKLDWVENKGSCVGWFLSGEHIMGVYENSDGTGTYLCHAILEEGKLDMDEYDFGKAGAHTAIMKKYGLGINPEYDR